MSKYDDKNINLTLHQVYLFIGTVEEKNYYNEIIEESLK
jgi:hypothetical protein